MSLKSLLISSLRPYELAAGRTVCIQATGRKVLFSALGLVVVAVVEEKRTFPPHIIRQASHCRWCAAKQLHTAILPCIIVLISYRGRW